MDTTLERSDRGLLNLLAQNGPMGIAELTEAMQVTATAVRQRLTRVMAQGLVEREPARAGRGRPSHRYSLTSKGRREMGSNFADLTMALWHEIRSIRDPDIRGGLLRRIAKSLAGMYAGRVSGSTTAERMQGISELMAERNVPFAVEYKEYLPGECDAAEHAEPAEGAALPVLTAASCPYPELAEQDRGICAVEKMLFSELLEQDIRLSDCRLDGATCCRFETN